MRATSSHGEITVPGTPHIAHALEVSAGSEARRFGIHVRPNYFFGEEQGHDRREGPPIEAFLTRSGSDYEWHGDLEFEGGRGEIAEITCSGPRYHGGHPTAFYANFYLPAGGRGTFVVNYRIVQYTQPWPTTDYRALFKVSPPHPNLAPPGYDATRPPAPGAVPTADVVSPGPVVHGKRGVQIALTTDPPITDRPGGHVKQYGPNTLFTIRGRTDPPLRRQRILLEYEVYPGVDDPAPLAEVVTDDAGRFKLRAWRPHAAGQYLLYARYASRSAELVDDFTCPWAFYVTEPGDPAPELRIDTARLTVKHGIAEVPLRCIGAPPSRCKGRLLLTGRGWRSTARYDLAAPGGARVKMAVPGAHGGSALLRASPGGPARRVALRG